jgi:hypothetical protein
MGNNFWSGVDTTGSPKPYKQNLGSIATCLLAGRCGNPGKVVRKLPQGSAEVGSRFLADESGGLLPLEIFGLLSPVVVGLARPRLGNLGTPGQAIC